MNLKLFIFTVDEYLRFRKVFVKNEIENSVEDNYEQEYVSINTRLMLLRKYFNKKENVSILKIAKTAIDIYPENKQIFIEIIEKYNEIQNNQLVHLLADQTKLNLYETIENTIYGLYLHADENKIKNIIQTNEHLRFYSVKSYVLNIEAITLNLYKELRRLGVEEKIVDRSLTAPVIKYGELPKEEDKIVENEYWINTSGKALSDEPRIITKEKGYILGLGWNFIQEIESENFNPKTYKAYFKSIKLINRETLINIYHSLGNIKDLGMSDNIQFNKNKTEARTFFLPQVKVSFVLTADHLVVEGIVFRMEKTLRGWKIKDIYMNGRSLLKK